jgi:cell wall-associated NlpC family hydrolase
MGILTEQEIIKKYLGVPYVLHGRTLEGLDCWGLIKCVYADLGFNLIDIGIDYDEKWAQQGKNYFAENYYTQWRRVYEWQLYDVMLFESGAGILNHAGIYLSNYRVIHTCRAGTVISNLDAIRKRVEAYRFKIHDYSQVCT